MQLNFLNSRRKTFDFWEENSSLEFETFDFWEENNFNVVKILFK